MKLITYRVQYETEEKKPFDTVGWLKIGVFYAYSELHLQTVMKETLGYYPPIYHIFETDQQEVPHVSITGNFINTPMENKCTPNWCAKRTTGGCDLGTCILDKQQEVR